MDSLIFELQIVFYFQLFLSANVRHRGQTITAKKPTKSINSHQKTQEYIKGN